MTSTMAACRSCGGRDLTSVLSLGDMPLANALLTPDQLGKPEPSYPLDLVFCPQCSLLQITETVPGEVLFGEYIYFSSFSDTMLDHARGLVARLIIDRGLGSNHLVIEVGSNDGYLLQFYAKEGVPVLGIDPAANVARVAREERGIPTTCEFFGSDLAVRLKEENIRADVLHAHNVLAHVSDLNGFVDGIALLLKESGVAVIEVPYATEMIERCEFDTIYHEHLCYFSLAALDGLFTRHGLRVNRVERDPIHGGSLRLFVSRGEESDSSVTNLLEEEQVKGVNTASFYQEFGRQVYAFKADLVRFLKDLKSEGHHLAAYGAAAKGSIMLNFLGVGGEILDFVVDRSVYKQGHYMPGVHLPIYAPEKLLESVPDYVLLLAWNFAQEIVEQQAGYRTRGGRFIVPHPAAPSQSPERVSFEVC